MGCGRSSAVPFGGLGHNRHCNLFLGSVGLRGASSVCHENMQPMGGFTRGTEASPWQPAPHLWGFWEVLAPSNRAWWWQCRHTSGLQPLHYPVLSSHAAGPQKLGDIMNGNYYFKLLYFGVVYYLATDNLVNYIAGPHLGKWKCLYKNLMFI